MKKKNNCLIIGLGQIGLLYDFNLKTKSSLSHISSIKRSSFFSLYGIVDNNKKIRKICKTNYNTKTFNNLDEVDCKKFDLIIVSTPTHTHYEIIKKILTKFSAKVILAEKPFTMNFIHAKKLNQLALRKRVNIFVNYSRISDISSEILKKKIDKAPYSICKIFYSKSILNNGSHFVNLLQFFFGKVTKLETSTNKIENFVLKFKKAIAIFKKKDSIRTNNLLIENKKFSIDYRLTSNKIFLISKTQRKNISSYNKDLNFFVIKNLENFLKKKKYRLCSLKQALETHKILQLIKKVINMEYEKKKL